MPSIVPHSLFPCAASSSCHIPLSSEDPIVQWPRTPPFHGGNTGSNPVRVADLQALINQTLASDVKSGLLPTIKMLYPVCTPNSLRSTFGTAPRSDCKSL